jgi:hypothetical protein
MKAREGRPADPFEIYLRTSQAEQVRAERAVPEWARPAVAAAAVGLYPREMAAIWGEDPKDAARRFRAAERALAEHFARRPEARLHHSRPLRQPPEEPSLAAPALRIR